MIVKADDRLHCMNPSYLIYKNKYAHDTNKTLGEEKILKPVK